MQKESLFPVVQLKNGKDEAVRRFHPWVFSGAIQQLPAGLAPGDIVTVISSRGEVLGTAFYEPSTIALKMLSFVQEQIDFDFWKRKILIALQLREGLGVFNNDSTTAYRLVHSEGDGLPGLIVDVYGSTAVLQSQSTGVFRHRQTIAEAIVDGMKGKILSVYSKRPEAAENTAGVKDADTYLVGEKQSSLIYEHGLCYTVDWEKGQKTGFFLDQRDARLLLKDYTAEKDVLNTFSYSGGFSIAALAGNARRVISVDSSKTAIALCNENVALNSFSQKHESVCVDAKKYLTEMPSDSFEVIVLDPPAFAKNHHHRHKGMSGYRFINTESIRKIKSGGFLFTFSCSQAIDRAAFQGIIMASAIEAGRTVQLLHHLSQPADHPVSIFHPEGAYLKGLVLRVI